MRQRIENGRYGYYESHNPKWSIEAVMKYDDEDFTEGEATQLYVNTLQNIVDYLNDSLHRTKTEES